MLDEALFVLLYEFSIFYWRKEGKISKNLLSKSRRLQRDFFAQLNFQEI